MEAEGDARPSRWKDEQPMIYKEQGRGQGGTVRQTLFVTWVRKTLADHASAERRRLKAREGEGGKRPVYKAPCKSSSRINNRSKEAMPLKG